MNRGVPEEGTPAPDGPRAAPLTELPCRNCGDPTPGNYCRACGQRKAEHRASVRRLIADALQDQFSLTSELPRTFKALVLKPGFLTAEYSRGRIASYIPPFRVYLFTSIIFFLLLSLQASGRSPLVRSNLNAKVTVDSTDVTTAPGDTIRGKKIELTPFAAVNKRLKAKTTEWANNKEEYNERLKEFMLRRSPTVIFLLLPVFALIMQLFYIRSGRYYAEHFIFALHTHAMAFLVFTVLVVLPDKGVLDLLGTGIFIWLMIYPLIAMRRVYSQGWIITFMKYLVVGFIYTSVFGFAMYIQFVTALLLM